MPDREKVINDFIESIGIIPRVDEPTFWLDFVRISMENALKLLKAQEPIEPKVTKRKAGFGNALYCEFNCGNCNKPIERLKYRFCPYCGKGIKWDESKADD